MIRKLFVTAALVIAGINLATAAEDPELEGFRKAYKRPTTIPFPADNPYSAEKAQLGKMLFFDQRLSRNFNMTCATCHNPSLGWEDGVPGAFGGQGKTLDRHSPTILNMAWGDKFFWDGRAATLETQIIGPVESPGEMNVPLPVVVERLEKVPGYVTQFNKVFPDGMTINNLLKAIATYERTIVSGTAPFDLWVQGDDDAISDDAKEGFRLFNTKANCAACHSGWNFTDNKFHDIGLPGNDNGRGVVSGDPTDNQSFKTPGLRNITLRAPYMHDGSLKNLEQVMSHYIMGGLQRETLSQDMQSVALSSGDVKLIIAFLESLQGEDVPVSLPILPI